MPPRRGKPIAPDTRAARSCWSFRRARPDVIERFSRRRLLQAGGAAALLASGSSAFAKKGEAVERLEAIRARIGGRLGVYAFDTHTGQRVGLDQNSRYSTASTFKMLLAAAVLKRVDRGELSLTQLVAF